MDWIPQLPGLESLMFELTDVLHQQPKIFIIVDVRAKSDSWAPIGKLLLSTEDILH